MPTNHTHDRPRFGKVLARASTNPLNLGIGAAAATLAIGLGSLPLAALGIVAYGAMVAFDAFNPAFWKKVYALPAPRRVELPEPKQIVDPGTRASIAKLVAAKLELDRTLRDTPADVKSHLAGALASLDELEAHAARLVARAEDIARHLAKVDVGAVRAEIAHLVVRASHTPDPDARRNFDDAREARALELATLDELLAAKDRIDANLLHLVAVISGLLTKVVHLRALDNQAADRLTGDLNAELEAVGQELRSSEDVMKLLGEIR
jgi:hypothetical protein